MTRRENLKTQKIILKNKPASRGQQSTKSSSYWKKKNCKLPLDDAFHTTPQEKKKNR